MSTCQDIEDASVAEQPRYLMVTIFNFMTEVTTCLPLDRKPTAKHFFLLYNSITGVLDFDDLVTSLVIHVEGISGCIV